MTSAIVLFAVLGAGTGALYTLSAFGMVLIYRASGVLNFAIGAMGMAGTFVYWELEDDYHLVPLPVAIVAGVAVSAMLGLGTYFLMTLMRKSSNLMRAVLTLTILVVIEGVVGLRYSPNVNYTATSIFPTGSVHIFGEGVGIDRLMLIGLTIVITAVIWSVYRYTRFGLATSAVAENTEVLATLGWSPNRISMINWTLGSGLAGLSGILLAPILGVSTALATDLLLPTLAAAVLGNLSSFPLTLAGGLAIGIAQSEILRFAPSTGFLADVGNVIPYIAIIAVVVIRGRSLPLRSYVAEKLPRVTLGHVPLFRVARYTVVVAIALWWLLPVDWVEATTTSLAFALVLLSIVLVTGYAGQISLTQWTIAGTGAVVASQLVVHGMSYGFAIVLGVLSGAPIGALLGIIAFRARGLSLAIATLAFNACVVSVILTSESITGGTFGLNVGYIHIFGVDIDPVNWPRRYALFTLVLVVLVSIGLANLRRGRVGRRLLALRANERSAGALGIDIKTSKIMAFSLSAMIASLGGIVTIFLFPSASFSEFDSMTSIQLVSNGALGGIGFVTGPLIGAQGAPAGISARLLDLIPGISSNLLVVLLGVLTIYVITGIPDGLVPQQTEVHKSYGCRIRALLASPLAHIPKNEKAQEWVPLSIDETAVTPVRAERTVLEAEHLRVVFGNVTAVDDVSFSLRSGEILGVMGPNGAGKTTLIDALTGFVNLRQGAIRLNERELAGMSVRQRARLGLSRSFQSLELFEDLSVRENILAACDPHNSGAWLSDLVHPREVPLSSSALSAIKSFGLGDILDALPGELPLAERKLVAFARAIAASPRVILLDEPAAGLDDKQRAYFRSVVRQLAVDWRMAVLLVEHDVDLVCAVSDRVLALNFGRMVILDQPEIVRSCPEVVESYLGVKAKVPQEVIEL